jgi:hypothetical protein
VPVCVDGAGFLCLSHLSRLSARRWRGSGLGVVVLGLGGELEKRSHAVDIILPTYDCIVA